MSGKKATADIDRRPAQALEAYEKALRALGKKEHERARDLFDALLESYPEERDLLERARSYRAFCERTLSAARSPAFRPRTFEEVMSQGVFLHNRGDFPEALKLFRQAAEMHPRDEHAQYCLAAAAARAGDAASAVKALRSAMTVSPETRAQARRDPDFDAIREDESFRALLHSASA
jgi:tetratricopeptide (TPR) repeat protein